MYKITICIVIFRLHISSTQFPNHVDLQKVGEIIFNNEKFNIFNPTTHIITDHFKEYMQRRQNKNIPSKRIFIDDNGFRHFWSGFNDKIKSLRKTDIDIIENNEINDSVTYKPDGIYESTVDKGTNYITEDNENKVNNVTPSENNATIEVKDSLIENNDNIESNGTPTENNDNIETNDTMENTEETETVSEEATPRRKKIPHWSYFDHIKLRSRDKKPLSTTKKTKTTTTNKSSNRTKNKTIKNSSTTAKNITKIKNSTKTTSKNPPTPRTLKTTTSTTTKKTATTKTPKTSKIQKLKGTARERTVVKTTFFCPFLGVMTMSAFVD